MRSRFLRGAVAAVIAVGIGVLAPARPAHAFVDWPALIVDIALAAANDDGDGGPNEQLEAAKREIIAAIEASQVEIENRLESIAAADVQACVRSDSRNLANIDRFDIVTLELFALHADRCAALAVEYFQTVNNLAIADTLGFVIGPIHAVTMTAMAKAEFDVRIQMEDYIAAYEAVVVKLTPTDCTLERFKEQGGKVEKWWKCVAFNGDVGVSPTVTGAGNEPVRSKAEDHATRNTSRAVAKAALPGLRTALAQM